KQRLAPGGARSAPPNPRLTRPDPYLVLVRIVRTLEAFYRACPRLTLALVAAALLSGVLLPAFMLASGALAEAISTGRDFGGPLALVAGVFVAQRVLDPIREELGAAVWRRINQAVGLRMMAAASGPP